MADDVFGCDLRLRFARGAVDLDWSDDDLETVRGIDNLAQALQLRLLTDYGNLRQLGHSRYGSRIRDLLGEPLDRPNRELIRRYVRQAIRQDERVEEILQINVNARAERPDTIEVMVRVRAVSGEETQLEALIHA